MAVKLSRLEFMQVHEDVTVIVRTERAATVTARCEELSALASRPVPRLRRGLTTLAAES